jgi:Tfp pilus assembly protein PilF
LVMLAEMYAEDYYPKRARQLWEKVLALEPQHPVARQQLAYLYEQEGNQAAQWGNFKGALQVYQDGLNRLPDSQRLHMAMGRTYARQKNFDLARTSFERALALNPNDLSTLHDLFVIWLNQSAEADLLGVIDRIKAIQSPIASSFFIDLINHCIEANQESYAKTLLDYAEAHYSKDETTLLDLAMLRTEVGQEEYAADLLRRILKTNPDYAQANLRLGAIYYKMGQTRLAQRHWDKAEKQAQQEGDHEALYELKLVKDVLIHNKRLPQNPLELLRSMPPQLRQQMINQMPPELAAILQNGDFDTLEALLNIGIPGDFDEDDDDGDYF